MLQEYLHSLGFSDKERSIYLVLARVGVQPASVIARRSGLDRVTTYKHLKGLADRGFVKIYVRDGVQCFGVESFDAIENAVRDKMQLCQGLLDRFPTAANVLKSLKEGEDLIPKLQIFEGESGIRALFRDMLFTAKEEHVRQVRLLSCNTFTEWMGDEPLTKIVRTFFKDLRHEGITIEFFEATGGVLPEHLRKLSIRDLDLTHVPAAHGTTNIFIVGHTVYLACYKHALIGLKVKQAELSQMFHFLFDVLGRKIQ